MLDVDTLERAPAGELGAQCASAGSRSRRSAPIAFDPYAENRQTGGFILIDRTTLRTVAAGMAIDSLAGATNVHRQAGDVTPVMREEMKGQRRAGAVVHRAARLGQVDHRQHGRAQARGAWAGRPCCSTATICGRD